MEKEIIYWEMGDGSKIDIDKMSTYHLRNALKFVVKQTQKRREKKDGIQFSDKEIDSLTKKTRYQFENEENLWK